MRVLFFVVLFASLAFAQEGIKPSRAGAKVSKGQKEAEEEQTPELYLCTGNPNGVYHRLGMEIARLLKYHIDVKLIRTKGSWENLEAIDTDPRRCDAILAQDDAYALYSYEHPESHLTMERTASIYTEYVHLICNRSVGVERVFDLNPKNHKVMINEYGSGTHITWSLFKRLDKRFRALTSPEGSFNESLLKVADGIEAHCLVIVTAKGSKGPMMVDKGFGDRFKLLHISDRKLERPVGREQRPVYQMGLIPQGTYPTLQNEDIKTPTLNAIFFSSPEWKARYPKAHRRLAAALLQLISEIENKIK